MRRRNWLQLSRKLVDKTDLDYTLNAVQDAIGEASLSFFGEGVLVTTIYPHPFTISLSGTQFQGTVGNGIGYDFLGNLIRIDPTSTSSTNFTPTASDPTFSRWDLLVLEYTMTGDTSVPKPSDPITTISLNLHDDFILKVIKGTASASPSYPPKGVNDLIIAGLRIPTNATLGSQITLDLSVRENAIAGVVNVPVFKQEVLTGAIDGANRNFNTSALPFNVGSLLVSIDDRVLSANEYAYSAGSTFATITLNEAPALAQDVKAFYVVNSLNSQNPLSGAQEVPSGLTDGVNDTFLLSGKPADQLSTLVFVDGRFINSSAWQLIQGYSQAYIKFLSGSIPVPGQSIYVFYFVNSASVGVAPSGGGGGGGGNGGRYTATGSISSPVLIDPAVGIPITSDPRMLIFVASLSGGQSVTANPQIPTGAFVGQEIMLKGTNDSNFVTLNDGSGLFLNGPINLKNKIGISLLWDGAVWSENGRP